LEYFKFDDNAASSAVVAAVGNNGVWEAADGTDRNTSNATVSTDIGRDSGLDTKDTYHVTCDNTVYDNAFFKSGTIILSFVPQFSYDDAADQTLFHIFVDTGDEHILVYDAGNDKYELRTSFGGTTTTISSDAYTDMGGLTTIMAGWDYDNGGFSFLAVNGQVVDTGTNAGTASSGNAAYVIIGADSDEDGTTSLNADVYFDSYKAIDGCLLPYGGNPWLGNGEVNATAYHSDVLLYWGCEDNDSEIGSTTFSYGTGASLTTGAKFIGSKGLDSAGGYCYVSDSSAFMDQTGGSISFWFQTQQSSFSGNEYFWGAEVGTDTNNIIGAGTEGKGYWRLYLASGGSATSQNDTEGPTTGNWDFIRIEWGDLTNGGDVRLFVNGIQRISVTAGANFSTSDFDFFCLGRLAYGGGAIAEHDCFIDQVFITNNPDTPDSWSVMGVPLHQDYFYKDDTLKQLGTDYRMNRLPNGDLLFRDLSTVSGS